MGEVVKAFEVAGFARVEVVALGFDDKVVLAKPEFKIFDDEATDFFVFDDTFGKLGGGGFELGFEHDQEFGIWTSKVAFGMEEDWA